MKSSWKCPSLRKGDWSEEGGEEEDPPRASAGAAPVDINDGGLGLVRRGVLAEYKPVVPSTYKKICGHGGSGVPETDPATPILSFARWLELYELESRHDWACRGLQGLQTGR
jgi:hypothetical protein